MPRRGGVSDAPQPILHPIASHATFDDSTASSAAPPASTSPSSAPQPSQPSASEPQQQQQQQQNQQNQAGWKITSPDRPPPEQLSFSYLRSRKLEPYLPPPVDEQHSPPSFSQTLTHNFAPQPQHQYQQHQNQGQQQPQHQHTAGQAHHQQLQRQQLQQQQQASSPESPAPSAHEEEGDHQHSHSHSHHHHHHHHQHNANHGDPAAEGEGEEIDDEEEEEDLDWKPRPFITLTYAQSLDSAIATAPGARTALSGPATKSMTHFLRSRHDAILVGVGTAVADDPGLNCRLEVEMGGGHQPRPVVLDPRARWAVSAESKVVQLAREGRGLGPWVLVAEGCVPDSGRAAVLEEVGGRYIVLERAAGRAGGAAGEEEVVEVEDAKGKKVVGGRKEAGKENNEEGGKDKGDGGDDDSSSSRPVLTWDNIFGVLWEEGINSVMVEGGATVINDLLLLANEGLDVVDSVIVTVAPVWLGAGAVTVAPERPVDAHMRRVPGPRLTDVLWTQMGDDMVLCGRIMR